MIAHVRRRKVVPPPEPVPAPRLHGLARLALARIDNGHDRLEAVMAALIEAVQQPGLPSCYDHLSPLQREVVLAMWGNGPTRLAAVAKAVRFRRLAIVWRVMDDLVRNGVLERIRKGLYQISPNPIPELRPRPGSHVRDVVLRRVLAEGPAQISDLAWRFGVHVKTMHRRLAPLLAGGEARRVREGVYALAEVA